MPLKAWRQTGPGKGEGRDWSYAVIAKTQRSAGNHQKVEDKGRILSYNIWKEHVPADTLLSNFQPPKL